MDGVTVDVTRRLVQEIRVAPMCLSTFLGASSATGVSHDCDAYQDMASGLNLPSPSTPGHRGYCGIAALSSKNAFTTLVQVMD